MTTSDSYLHLGPFSDWVAVAGAQRTSTPAVMPGPEMQSRLRDALGFCGLPETPADVQIERHWEKDDIAGEVITWSVGYGPRLESWLLRPADAVGPLPGALALHDHGGFKYLGKEKIADGPDDAPDYMRAWWDRAYGGRAWANALAREGFAVLVPDVFLWGSRRFPLEVMPAWTKPAFAALEHTTEFGSVVPHEVGLYNFAAAQHEHIVEKYCALLGTTLAGVVAYEDRIAVNYLRSRPDIDPDRIGCAGLSGGGARAALLQATHNALRATVITCMMSTYAGLLDRHLTSHTWMFFPPAWARQGDWPDLAACRAPSPLLVQYALDDALFPRAGMIAADARLKAHYTAVGSPQHYTSQFFPGPHRFDQAMQAGAFAWLKAQFSAR